MLGAVPDVDIVVRGEGGDDVGVLRLVTSLVDLAWVNHLLKDGELDLLFGCTKASKLFSRRVVVGERRRRWFGKVDLRDLEVFGLCARGVSADHQAVGAKSCTGDVLDVGHPLSSQGRPLKRTTIHDVVEEHAVLLPNLVLLVDDFLVDLLLVLGRLRSRDCEAMSADNSGMPIRA